MREILSNMVNLVRSFCVCSGLIHLAQQRRQTTSSDFHFHHHQCQASHSGLLLLYQCNHEISWYIIQHHTIWQYNKYLNSRVYSFLILGTVVGCVCVSVCELTSITFLVGTVGKNWNKTAFKFMLFNVKSIYDGDIINIVDCSRNNT